MPSRDSWIQNHRRDYYFRKAKSDGFRSRAAYKLLQIEKKFHVFQYLVQHGTLPVRVLDLCCAPGSFLEAIEHILRSHRLSEDQYALLGIDCSAVTPLPGATLWRGDVFDQDMGARVEVHFGTRVDAITADCAPKLSGDKNWDSQVVVALAERALQLAEEVLREGGQFVTKIFQGVGFTDFVQAATRQFKIFKTFKPKASRARSREMYCVGLGFQP